MGDIPDFRDRREPEESEHDADKPDNAFRTVNLMANFVQFRSLAFALCNQRFD